MRSFAPSDDLCEPFPQPVIAATFLRRRQRFLADMRLADGTELTAHCANTGSMRATLFPGAAAWIWDSKKTTRKLPHSWLAIQGPDAWIGVDTLLPNRLTARVLRAGALAPLRDYPQVSAERVLEAGSRVDLLLEGAPGRCWVEVKNVTLVEEGTARFPDAVTERGRKHLGSLTRAVQAGERAAMVFVVQRADGRRFRPADDIDPAYGAALRAAVAAGVEVYALGCTVEPRGVCPRELLPLEL